MIEPFKINFVFDDWNNETNYPNPNRPKKNIKVNDEERGLSQWLVSSEPMRCFEGVDIVHRKIDDVLKYPNEIFYYHVWHRNSLLWQFFSKGELPIDNKIINLIKRNSNLHLILMNECEFESKQSFQFLIQTVKKYNINPKQIWFINNNEKLNYYKELFSSDINVHTSRSMCIAVKYNNPINIVLDKSGPFMLCHNRSPRPQRYALLTRLMKKGFLEKDINWSLINGWSFNDLQTMKYYFNVDEILSHIKELNSIISIESKKSNYELEYPNFNDKNNQSIFNESKSYENSYINIVTETNFGEDIHITEKSFKPFFYLQIPIFCASQHHVKYFREAYPELDLFDDIIPHSSYDDIENERERMIAIVSLIEYILNHKEEFINYYKKNIDRIIKNHQIMVNYFNKYDYDFFKYLSELKPEWESSHFLNLVYDNWDYEKSGPIHENAKEIYTDSFMMPLDSFVNSCNLPEDLIRRYPIEEVYKYPDRKFYYFVTLTPYQIAYKIGNGILPVPQKIFDIWISNANFNLVFANEQEYEGFDCIKVIDDWTKFLNLPQERFFIANNNIRLNDYKKILNSNLNVYSTSKVRDHISTAMMRVMPNLNYQEDKKFLFLCHNRRIRPHRYALLAMLKKENILDSIDYSLSNGWDGKTVDKSWFYQRVLNQNDIQIYSDELDFFQNIYQKKSYYEEDKIWFREDNIHSVNWGETYEQLTYEMSYFNIVTETEFDNIEIHISEKSFKPFVAFQFPLILASPYHIKEIRKYYDFDFFDDIIDHSYDLIEDHNLRLKTFVKEIKKIYENKNFYIEFYKQNKERFLKNHNYACSLGSNFNDLEWLKNLRESSEDLLDYKIL